jgi:hypothetical protein
MDQWLKQNAALYEEFEDTKGVIRIRKSKKKGQNNGQKKKGNRTNNSSIEAPSIYYLRWCSEVVPEVIACAGATGSCITGYDVTGSCITGSYITGSREPEMKGRYFPAFFRYFPRFLFYPYFLLVFPELL